ncbi:hypothetical protein [Kitasatospora griseola]
MADALAAVLHNCAMLVIAAQVVLVYAAAGRYKVQGARWQDLPAGLRRGGRPSGLPVRVGGRRRPKNALPVLTGAEHLAVAVVPGLPFRSSAMLAAGAVLRPAAALSAVERVLTGRWRKSR